MAVVEHVAGVMREWAQADPDRLLVTFDDEVLSAGALVARGEAFARDLSAAGVKRDDRVGFFDMTSPATLVTLYATSVLGAVFVPLNWRLTSAELLVLIDDAGVATLVVGDRAPLDLIAARPGLRSVHCGSLGNVDAAAPQLGELVCSSDSTAVQMYTSGTTGRSKGVLISHLNLVGKFRHPVEAWRMGADSMVLACMPLFHIGGLGWLIGALMLDASVVITPTAAPAQLVDAIRRLSVTHLFLVPAAVSAMLEIADGDQLPSLQVLVYGAAPMERGVLDAALDRLGCDLVQGYGLTETTGQVVSLSGPDHLRFRDQDMPTGRADEGIELTIRPLTDHADLAEVGVGEVLIRGDQLARGYWNVLGSSHPTHDDDGWFRSGDLGRIDADGYLTIIDRIKDLVISGGENIAPSEVEACLERHPMVREAAVIGAPSPRWGEVPVAIVVVAEGYELDRAELDDHCRGNLTTYKCPVDFIAAESLPRNATGKILKRELRDEYDSLAS